MKDLTNKVKDLVTVLYAKMNDVATLVKILQWPLGVICKRMVL